MIRKKVHIFLDIDDVLMMQNYRVFINYFESKGIPIQNVISLEDFLNRPYMHFHKSFPHLIKSKFNEYRIGLEVAIFHKLLETQEFYPCFLNSEFIDLLSDDSTFLISRQPT